MHPMPAMFRGGVGRDSAVVGLAEDGADVGGRCRHRAQNIGGRGLFPEGVGPILRGRENGAVAAVGCAIRETTRGGWGCLAKDEELDEGSDQQNNGELAQQETLCEGEAAQGWVSDLLDHHMLGTAYED